MMQAWRDKMGRCALEVWAFRIGWAHDVSDSTGERPLHCSLVSFILFIPRPHSLVHLLLLPPLHVHSYIQGSKINIPATPPPFMLLHPSVPYCQNQWVLNLPLSCKPPFYMLTGLHWQCYPQTSIQATLLSVHVPPPFLFVLQCVEKSNRVQTW